MAQMLVLSIPGQQNVVALSSNDVLNASVRTTRVDLKKPPRHALWTFRWIGDGFGNLYDHQHYRMLHHANGVVSLAVGNPNTEELQWRIDHKSDGTVTFSPRGSEYAKMLAHPTPESGVTLVYFYGNEAITRWNLTHIDSAQSVIASSLDDAAVDEHFYNIEVVTRAGDDSKRLYLAVESEEATEVPLKIGSDPKSSSAQFRLYPAGTGRIVSDGRIFGTVGGHEGYEHVVATAPAPYEIEMINMSGAHTFVHEDRVAMRTAWRKYVGWTNLNELTTKAWTPGSANEIFRIKKIGGTGEIRVGDRFALLAGNGRHLTHDRGAADNHVSAAATHIDAWETFTLGAPRVRAFQLRTKNLGRPVTGARDVVGDVVPLVQKSAYIAEEFSLDDRGDGMFSLVLQASNHTGEVVPLSNRGVVEGQQVACRINSQAPGMLFRVVPAPPSSWPDTPDLTMDKYRDPAEDYGRTVIGAVGMIAGTLSGVPGGAAIFTAVFDRLWPAGKVSMHDVLSQFREDILRDVKSLIAENATFQATGALRSAHEKYLITYINLRRAGIYGGSELTTAKQTALSTADNFSNVLNFLSLQKVGTKISETDQNVAMIRKGLPVYAICVAEYMNALQETALIHAYQPNLVLPDVRLRIRGQYMTSTSDRGAFTMATDNPLRVAVRLLNRNGSKTLKHGDTVVLRTPGGTNITAVNGGGGALSVKTPASQIGKDETYVIERSDGGQTGQVINTNDKVVLRVANGANYVSAPAGGGAVNAGGTLRGKPEVFTIEITPFTVKAAPPQAPPQAASTSDEPPYMAHVANLRSYASLRYNDARDMFELLVKDRIGKSIHVNKRHWQEAVHGGGGDVGTVSYEDRYSLSFRDDIYNIDINYVHPGGQNKPAGWDDPDRYEPLQLAIEHYRRHIAQTYYYFKYRYFEAVRPLLTIADDTQRLCEQIWKDPLVATEFAYVSRSTPEYQG
jgi:hypothetical protein